jgi:hypothetical protein
MKSPTTISRSKDRVHELTTEIKEMIGALKVERDDMTRISVRSEKLDKHKVDYVYNLRLISETLASLDMAHYALKCAHICLSGIKQEGTHAD